MLYTKVLHIIAIISWFSGLFYMPRLLHCAAVWRDREALHYLPIMAYKLYHYITTPAALVTVASGLALLLQHQEYFNDSWLHTKISLVVLLVIYHCYIGSLVWSLRSHTTYACPNYYLLLLPPAVLCMILSSMAIIRPCLG